jgi:hypothetical protein
MSKRKNNTTPPGKRRKLLDKEELKAFKIENALKYEDLLTTDIPIQSKLEKRVTALALKNSQKIDYKLSFYYKDFLKITKQAIRASITENTDEFNHLFSDALVNEIKDIRTELMREANKNTGLSDQDFRELYALHQPSTVTDNDVNNEAMNETLAEVISPTNLDNIDNEETKNEETKNEETKNEETKNEEISYTLSSVFWIWF